MTTVTTQSSDAKDVPKNSNEMVISNKAAELDSNFSEETFENEPEHKEDIRAQGAENNQEKNSCQSFIALWRKIEGKLTLLLSGIFSAIAFSLAKFFPSMPVGQFSATSSLFVILLIFPLLFFNESRISFHGKLNFIVIRAFCGGIFLLSNFWSARVMDFGDATALGALVPIFAALSSRFLWKEKMSIFTLLAMVIGIAGTVLIAKPTFLFGKSDEDKDYSPYFPLVPISASIILGFGYSFMRKVGTDVSPLLVSALVAMFNVINGVVFQLCYGESFAIPACFDERAILFASGIFLFLTVLFINRGLTIEKSGVGTTMINFDIVVAYFLQIFFFDSVPNAINLIGAVLVIGSIVLCSVDKLLLKCFKFEI